MTNSSSPDARYAGHLNHPAIGAAGHGNIRAGRVAVVGCGGLAAPVVTYLAAAGVGTITLVDADVVSSTNLARQVLFTLADVGRKKVEVLADAIHRVNDEVAVKKCGYNVTAANAVATLSGCDVIVDATDNSTARYLVDDVSAELSIPVVWGAMSADAGVVTVFGDRQSPRRLRDVFPVPSDANADGACAVAGVVGPLCGVVGSKMAAECLAILATGASPAVGVLEYLDGFGRHTNRLLVPSADGESSADSPATSPTPPVSSASQGMSADEFAERAGDVAVVDIRPRHEFDQWHVPGAVWLQDASVAALTKVAGGDVVICCATGVRARGLATAAAAAGVCGVRFLVGGMASWREHHHS